ncbi:MAG: ABC transporter ATP-binding protein, partial [Clostridiales bacterium]|nr:ABC transporter ATP-binding protein [Clostridiales bacterium]
MGSTKKSFIIGCIGLTFANLLYAIVPAINRVLIDDVLSSSLSKAGDVVFLCAIILLIRVLSEAIVILCGRMISKAGSKYSSNLRHLTYKKIQQLSMASLGRKTSGDLLKRITQDTQRVREFIIDQGKFMIEQTVVFIVVTVILFISNPFLAALIILPAPIVFWLSTIVWSKVMHRYDKQWRLNSKSNSILHDIIKGIRVIKAFGNEEREIKKFDKSCRDLAKVSTQNEKTWAFLFPILGFIASIGEFFVLYFGGHMVLGRTLSLGELVQFTIYIAYIYGPMRWLTGLPRWLADVMTSLLKIFEILDEEPEIKDIKEPVELDVIGAIEFDDVTFGYKPYEPVLKNITVSIKPGEMIGLVGHSGTGKTTMINLVMRLYDINSGKLSIDGVDIRRISQKTLHESIGVVFQENFLFAGTIYDNIAYAKPKASHQEIISAAKIANAHEFIIKLPDSYNTMVGENGYTLSGGERQRIAIARAILCDPEILILDEATSTLDVETEAKIQEALGRLVKGRTTIAIAHRLSTLRGADRLFVLEKGRLAECGTHK